MIKVNIRFNQYLGGIEFPCDEIYLKRVLESMHVPENIILKPEIIVTDIDNFDELNTLKDKFVNLDELNYLAKRLVSFDKMELDTFKAGVINGHVEDMKDLINLTFNPNKYILIKNLSNPESIGKRYYLAKNLMASEKELLETDFDKIGKQVIASGNTKLTPYGMLINNNDVDFEEVYNGKTFPAYGYSTYSFLAEITYGDNTEYVYMPDDDIVIDKAVKRLGAESLKDCLIDIEYGDLSDYEWFEKIKGITYTEGLKEANRVLDYFDELSNYDIEKLKSLTEFANRSDGETIIKLIKNISEFDYFPDVNDMDELGRALIAQEDEYLIHEDISDYFMYEQYAEDVMRDYDLKFTMNGAVVLKGQTLTEIIGGQIEQEEDLKDDFDMTMM